MKIHLHIDRLVLEGLHQADLSEAGLRREVAAELSSLLAADALTPALQRSAFRAAAASSDEGEGRDPQAQTLGQQIGRAVYRGISR